MCSKFDIFLLLLSAAVSSCSVLENRDACPCRLHLDLSDPANFAADSLQIQLLSDSFFHMQKVSSELYRGGVTVTVPWHGGVRVNVFDARTDLFDGDGRMVIPVGEQCPEVYMYASFCDTYSDDTEEYVRLRKNFCKVSVSFITDEPQRYEMAVTGNVCGYDADGTPMEGMFSFVPAFQDTSVGYVCVPRQKDSSLKLSITSPEGAVRYFALGSYISDSGYDWSRADLDDIAVSIDYAATSVRIVVDDWVTDIPCEVVI